MLTVHCETSRGFIDSSTPHLPPVPAGVLQWERHQRYIWAACLLLYLLLVLVAVILSCTATTHTSLTTSLDTACNSFIL